MLECYEQYSAKQWAELGKYVFHHGRYSAAPLNKYDQCVSQSMVTTARLYKQIRNCFTS